jgi:DNA-binding MarR family transcriptional regulator
MDDYVRVMAKNSSDAYADAWIALMRAQQGALLKIERALRAAELPPLAWYDVLWELERRGDAGLRPYEIERQMLIAQSNISRLLDRLQGQGYVERRACEEDGRGQLVVITPGGRELRRRMWPIYAKAIRQTIGARVSEREAAALADVLTKLIDTR